MPEKETKHIEEKSSYEQLREDFLKYLSDGEVHEARKVLKDAEERGEKIKTSEKEFIDAAQKAVEDSLRKGHVRHAVRLLGFASDNHTSVDLSKLEISQALSEGFEQCDPGKKEEILEFAQENNINIETS